jgi:hypothetical protein
MCQFPYLNATPHTPLRIQANPIEFWHSTLSTNRWGLSLLIGSLSSQNNFIPFEFKIQKCKNVICVHFLNWLPLIEIEPNLAIKASTCFPAKTVQKSLCIYYEDVLDFSEGFFGCTGTPFFFLREAEVRSWSLRPFVGDWSTVVILQ